MRQNCFRTLLVVQLLAAAFFVLAGSASAHEDGLDPGYGHDGMAISDAGTAGVEPDVELTVHGATAFVGDGPAGTGALFSSDGSIDNGFGRHGRFSVSAGGQLLDLGHRRFFPSAITIDKRDRVLAFGGAVDTGSETPAGEGVPVSSSLAAVIRFGHHGNLDPSFGRDRGYTVGRFGLPTDPSTGAPEISVSAGAVDARERPVFVVSAVGHIGACEGHGTEGSVPRGLARLTSPGLLDSSFGVGGLAAIHGGGGTPVLSLDTPDGPVAGVGNVGSYAARCGEGSILYRFDQGGAPVPGFGEEGKVLRSMHLAVVQASGATVLVEGRGSTIEIGRLRPDGSRAGGFGHRGIAVVHLPRAASSHVVPAAVDSHGRILLVGDADSISSKRKGGAGQSSLVVGRLLPNGRLDRSFGKDGWLFSRLPKSLRVLDTDAALDSEGRLLVGGLVTGQRSTDGDDEFIVARYLVGS